MLQSEGTHEIIKNPNGYIYKCNPLEINVKKFSEMYKIVEDFEVVVQAYKNEIKANDDFYNIGEIENIINSFKLVINYKNNRKYFISVNDSRKYPNSDVIYNIEKTSNGYIYQVNFDKMKSLEIDKIVEIFDLFISLNEEHYCKKIDIDKFYNKKELFEVYNGVIGSMIDKSSNRLATFKRDREEALRFIGQ